ncbi:hypothetical protein X961_4207 [Burkholderia pseudomallei MSHR5613]|nr:hypothetical protein X961_4207 [Burkholderia pseudomallei MSHR5613]
MGRQLSQCVETVRIGLVFVLDQIQIHHPSMRIYISEWDLSLLKKLNHVRTRDIQKVGGLLGRQFGMDWNDRHRIAISDLVQDLV